MTELTGRRVLVVGGARDSLVGRHGQNEDITDAVMCLLSAGFVSGETIHVEGGARHA